MKEIKILHLFPKLLSLYGEYANISVLKYYLEKNSYTVNVFRCEDGNSDFSSFDMIYVGSGTEDNILHGAKMLMPHKDKIRTSIENGDLWLSTGNSLALFGEKIITSENDVHNALSIFSFTVTEENKRFSGDVMTKEICGYPLIGYINNSYRLDGISSHFSEFTLNTSLGNDKKNGKDGYVCNNFYASALTGPLFVKNPHVMEYFIEKMTGEKIPISDEDNIKKAYTQSLSQLEKRKNNHEN